MNGKHTLNEISTQFDAWNDALMTLHTQHERVLDFWHAGKYDALVFTGCGSTHYLALAAAHLAQTKLGIAARGIPASELLFYPDSIYLRNSRPLLVTISRSAATTETIQAAQAFRARYGDHVLTISCYTDRPLNQQSTLTLAIRAGQEQSIAQTRSFSSMLVMAEALVNLLTSGESQRNQFPESSRHLVETARTFAESLADPTRFDRYFYLGSGARYGLASEGMLKMKEMSQTYAEPYHPMEFRHGPKSMVNDRTLVVGLMDDAAYEQENAVLDEMRALGATTVILSARPHADFSFADYVVQSLVYYLPLMQWLGYYRSIKKSLDPDQPHNLDMVVQLGSV